MTLTITPDQATLPNIQEIIASGGTTAREKALIAKLKPLIPEVAHQAGVIGALQRELRRNEVPLRFDDHAILRAGLSEARRENGNVWTDNRAVRNRNRRLRNRIGDLEMALGMRYRYQPRVVRVRGVV